jgi:tetratricopeptide (TPR) repeat protein
MNMVKRIGIIDEFIKEAHQLVDQGYYEEAIVKLQKCLRWVDKQGKGAAILYDLGYCFLRQGWYEEAVKIYSQLLLINPLDNDARFFRASAYASLKWTDEAIKELKIILTSDPKDVLARHDLALCYRDKGWIRESLDEMRRANACAMLYGETDEKEIVGSSLSHLEDETENGDDDKRSNILLLLLLALINKRRMFRLRTRQPS